MNLLSTPRKYRIVRAQDSPGESVRVSDGGFWAEWIEDGQKVTPPGTLSSEAAVRALVDRYAGAEYVETVDRRA